jgi:hypothetical protein
MRCAVIAAALLSVLLGAGTAEAKPTIYPVKITVRVKPSTLPPDSKWWHVPGVTAETPVIVLYGRVTSPKPACRRRRPIVALFKSPYETAEEGGVTSDAAGQWEGEPTPDFSFTEEIRSGKAHLWVKVARKRLGKGRLCAEAKSQPLKA